MCVCFISFILVCVVAIAMASPLASPKGFKFRKNFSWPDPIGTSSKLCLHLMFLCDEVTLIDFQSWISVHSHVLVDWKCIPILLTLERVVEGGTLDNLASMFANVVCCDGVLS